MPVLVAGGSRSGQHGRRRGTRRSREGERTVRIGGDQGIGLSELALSARQERAGVEADHAPTRLDEGLRAEHLGARIGEGVRRRPPLLLEGRLSAPQGLEGGVERELRHAEALQGRKRVAVARSRRACGVHGPVGILDERREGRRISAEARHVGQVRGDRGDGVHEERIDAGQVVLRREDAVDLVTGHRDCASGGVEGDEGGGGVVRCERRRPFDGITGRVEEGARLSGVVLQGGDRLCGVEGGEGGKFGVDGIHPGGVLLDARAHVLDLGLHSGFPVAQSGEFLLARHKIGHDGIEGGPDPIGEVGALIRNRRGVHRLLKRESLRNRSGGAVERRGVGVGSGRAELRTGVFELVTGRTDRFIGVKEQRVRPCDACFGRLRVARLRFARRLRESALVAHGDQSGAERGQTADGGHRGDPRGRGRRLRGGRVPGARGSGSARSGAGRRGRGRGIDEGADRRGRGRGIEGVGPAEDGLGLGHRAGQSRVGDDLLIGVSAGGVAALLVSEDVHDGLIGQAGVRPRPLAPLDGCGAREVGHGHDVHVEAGGGGRVDRPGDRLGLGRAEVGVRVGEVIGNGDRARGGRRRGAHDEKCCARGSCGESADRGARQCHGSSWSSRSRCSASA